MLVDEVVITVKAGDGGNGASTFWRNAQTAKGGPDGGNGGNGGSVYFQGTDDITALSMFRYKKQVRGETGVSGRKNNLFGRNGKDLLIFVPVGTDITDLKTGNVVEIPDTSTKVLYAKGGKGGRGNNEFKSATNQAPTYAEKGEPGAEKHVRLTLKLIAEIGLIGLPNAGKSSLLSVLTNASPKIGNYPFTTLEPNLGVMDKVVIADIPGLIEGASSGKGLGTTFLRHIEKTKLLLHCLDATTDDITKSYQTVRNELGTYNPKLLEKPEILLITKADMLSPEEKKQKDRVLKKLGKPYYFVSIYDDDALASLKTLLEKTVNKQRKQL